MAKRNISYAVERITSSLQNAMKIGVEQSQLLAIYKSRLFDVELVDKERRNQVLVEVNKNIGLAISMRDVRNASNDLLNQVLANGPEDSPEIEQYADELPPTTPEYILQNREEFTPAEITHAEKCTQHIHTASVEGVETTTPVVEANTNTQPIQSEDITMKVNSTNAYDNTTAAADFITVVPTSLHAGDQYVSFEIDFASSTVKHTVVDKDGKRVIHRTARDGSFVERFFVPEEAKAETKEEQKVADKSFMDSANGIAPEYLAAGAALLGAAGSILTSPNGINTANIVGGVAGVGVSYFASKHFLSERENDLVTKAMAVSGGLVAGAVMSRGADMLSTHFWGDTSTAVAVTGESVVAVMPVEAPVVIGEVSPMF